MGATSSPDLMTIQFECGMRRPDLQPTSHLGGPLLIARMSIQHPVIWLLISLTLFISALLPLVTKCHLIFNHCQTQRVGSETQKAVCYIGYLLTIVEACIHLLSSQSLEHPTFDPFHLILT